MKIQLNSDNQVVVNAALTGAVKSTVRRVLGKFENQLTRIEVHLSDLNSHRAGSETSGASWRPVPPAKGLSQSQISRQRLGSRSWVQQLK